jgi:hypothetical protein
MSALAGTAASSNQEVGISSWGCLPKIGDVYTRGSHVSPSLGQHRCIILLVISCNVSDSLGFHSSPWCALQVGATAPTPPPCLTASQGTSARPVAAR